MKTLTKLALVSAMAISGNAMAMQSLDDEALSATTGQDGITISLSTGISFDYLAIHDADGVGANHGVTTSSAGAIVIGDPTGATRFSLASGGLDIIIDADSNAGEPVLNVAMDFGNAVIDVGAIKVATSDDGAALKGSTLTNVTDALEVGTLTLDGLTVNLQLGNQPQGALIKLDSTIAGGLNLSSLDIISNNGASNTGSISLSDLTVVSNGSADLALNLLIDAVQDEGLVITGLTNLDIGASSVVLGGGTANSSIGALYISNLSVGDVTIRGH